MLSRPTEMFCSNYVQKPKLYDPPSLPRVENNYIGDTIRREDRLRTAAMILCQRLLYSKNRHIKCSCVYYTQRIYTNSVSVFIILNE